MEDIYVYDAGQTAPIEGLDELRKAISDLTFYEARRKEFLFGTANDMPKKPEASVAKLKDKYPRAAAYIKAEKWAKSASWKKGALGQKAMERIAAGEDHTMVLEEMEQAWAAFRLAQEG